MYHHNIHHNQNWNVGVLAVPSSIQQNNVVYVPTNSQGKIEAPPRRALQQIKHNQANVSVLQRLKNFVAPPRPSLKKVCMILAAHK
jgi:hypothetical protein